MTFAIKLRYPNATVVRHYVDNVDTYSDGSKARRTEDNRMAAKARGELDPMQRLYQIKATDINTQVREPEIRSQYRETERLRA